MKQLVSFDDLDADEKALIDNGCGPKGFLKPPTIDEFSASCAQHDFYYWRGGDFGDKLKADLFFVAHMFLDVAKSGKRGKMLFFPLLALLYWVAVSIFGHWSFKYRDAPVDRASLIAEVTG